MQWSFLIPILIPIVAILAWAFTEWLKVREKQSRLGTSTHELEITVAAQQDALETAQRRIQNLEAIVTSQMWDVVHDNALPEAEKQRALAQARIHLDPAPEEPTDPDKVAQMARRLRL